MHAFVYLFLRHKIIGTRYLVVVTFKAKKTAELGLYLEFRDKRRMLNFCFDDSNDDDDREIRENLVQGPSLLRLYST